MGERYAQTRGRTVSVSSFLGFIELGFENYRVAGWASLKGAVVSLFIVFCFFFLFFLGGGFDWWRRI